MINYFVQGGPVFMGLLTLLFVGVIIFSIRAFSDDKNSTIAKSIGLLALVIGILGQLIGLFSAFVVMESIEGGISPSILAGGLKVSLITTIYGLLIFLISRVFALILKFKSK